MPPPNASVSAILFIAGAFCFAGGYITLHTRNRAAGAWPLIGLMFSLCWWDVTYGLFLTNLPGLYPNFWLHVVYVGVVFTPPSVLVFAIQIAKMDEWSKPSYVIGLYAVPVFVLALLVSDSYHGLFFGGREILRTEMILNGGPSFWANVAYSHALTLASLLILTRSFRKATGVYRKQIGVVWLGVCIPWISNLFFVSGLGSDSTVDSTPLLFTVTGIIFTHALLHYRLLDIIPIARDVLIENMSDGIVVLDAQDRLVDFNRAALQSLNLEHPLQIGQPASEVFSRWANLVEGVSSLTDFRGELSLDQSPRVFFDLKISALYDQRANFLGRLIVWRDITPLKNAQAELQEQAIRDPLTGLYNRRSLGEILTRELARAAREGYPVSLAMMDIDDFKRLNDVHGHPVGDLILKNLAKILLDYTRAEDTVYRYGGEEFLVLLPICVGTDAMKSAERWRAAFQDINTPYRIETTEITISCGVAEFPIDGQSAEELIAVADQFLYRAKATGKNRIVGRGG